MNIRTNLKNILGEETFSDRLKDSLKSSLKKGLVNLGATLADVGLRSIGVAINAPILSVFGKEVGELVQKMFSAENEVRAKKTVDKYSKRDLDLYSVKDRYSKGYSYLSSNYKPFFTTYVEPFLKSKGLSLIITGKDETSYFGALLNSNNDFVIRRDEKSGEDTSIFVFPKSYLKMFFDNFYVDPHDKKAKEVADMIITNFLAINNLL